MKKCRYVVCHDDPNFCACSRCGRSEYGRIPIYEEVEQYWKRCPQCKALVKIPKKHRATKHGIIAVQGQFGDGIYLYNAHTKKFIGHSMCRKRMNASELAEQHLLNLERSLQMVNTFKERFENESTDCQNLSGDKFYHCPFKEERDKQKPFKDCIATKKKWKEWAMNDE